MRRSILKCGCLYDEVLKETVHGTQCPPSREEARRRGVRAAMVGQLSTFVIEGDAARRYPTSEETRRSVLAFERRR